MFGFAAAAGWLAAGLAKHLAPQAAAPSTPLVMALSLLMAAAACLAVPGPWPAPAGAVLGFALLTLMAVDLVDLRLPDAVTLPATAIGLIVSGAKLTGPWPIPTFAPGALTSHAIGAGAGYLVMAGVAAGHRRLRGRDGLGLGDAKLAAVAGAWLGWRALPVVVLIACAVAFGWIAARLLRRRGAGLCEALPFGPPLALAIWAVWIVEQSAGSPLQS